MVFKEMGMNGEERTIVAGSRGSGGRRRGSRRLSFG